MKFSVLILTHLWAGLAFIDKTCHTGFAESLFTEATLDRIYNEELANIARDLFKDG